MAQQKERVTLAELVALYRGQNPDLVLIDPDPSAEAIEVATRTLESWRREGKGPRFVKIGRFIKYPLGGLIEFVNKKTFTTTRQAKHGQGGVR